MAERLDPEMLKNIDLLLVMDVVESEGEWDLVEDLETVEQAESADGAEKDMGDVNE